MKALEVFLENELNAALLCSADVLKNLCSS